MLLNAMVLTLKLRKMYNFESFLIFRGSAYGAWFVFVGGAIAFNWTLVCELQTRFRNSSRVFARDSVM